MKAEPKIWNCAIVGYHNLLHEGGYRVRVINSLRLVRERAAARGIALRFHLAAFEGLRPFFSPRKRRELRAVVGDSETRIWIFPTLPEKHPLIIVVNLLLAGLALGLLGRLLRWRIAHAHATLAAFAGIVGRRLGRYGLFFDVHGADVAEREMQGDIRRGGLMWRLYSWMERTALQRADVAFCVSGALRERLGENVLSCIVPCCVEEVPPVEEILRRRETVRREMGLDGRLVIGYIGSAAVWQQPEEMAEAFAAIRRSLPEAFFLILTPDQNRFQDLLNRTGIAAENYRLLSAPHAQVKGISPAMDLGLLLRTDVAVNRVASPTKFAEYLAGGAPVLLTRALSDFAEMARRENVGVVWSVPRPTPEEIKDLLDFLRRLPAQRAELARRCRDLVAAELAWSKGGDSYWRCYEEYLLMRRPSDSLSAGTRV